MGGVLRTLRTVNERTGEKRKGVLDARQPREEYMGAHGTVSSFKNKQVHDNRPASQ